MLLEKNLVKDRGWVEYSVYPLYSPQSLIAEGSANFGIEMAFPGEERVRFEQDVLFPLAGLEAARAEAYYTVQRLAEKLAYAGNASARYGLIRKLFTCLSPGAIARQPASRTPVLSVPASRDGKAYSLSLPDILTR